MALMVLPLELSTEIGYIFIVLAGFGCFIAVDPVTHLCEKCQQESMFKYISYIYLYIYERIEGFKDFPLYMYIPMYKPPPPSTQDPAFLANLFLEEDF